MFGKIVKSVFLNKEARDAMEKRDAVLRRKAQADLPPEPESLADAASNAGREAELDDSLRNKANATDLERETIRADAGRASGAAAPVETAAPPRSSSPVEEHDDLVRSAMLIYRQKQKVLDDLDPASKKKLRMMAKTVFGSQIKK